MRPRILAIVFGIGVAFSPSSPATTSSDRREAFLDCLKDEAGSPVLFNFLNYQDVEQQGESCYAHSATRVWEYAAGPRLQGKQSNFSAECLALLYALRKWPLESQDIEALVLKAQKGGLLIDQGRDDQIARWLASERRLPSTAVCTSGDIVTLSKQIAELSKTDAGRSKVRSALSTFREKHRGEPLEFSHPLSSLRVHMWDTKFDAQNPSKKPCKDQYRALKHYACAGIPVSVNFFHSKGYIVTDGRWGPAATGSLQPTVHSAVVAGLQKIGVDGTPKNFFVTQDSKGAPGLSPKDRLIGLMSDKESCRVMRLTVLLNQDDAAFLKSVETLWRRAPDLSEEIDLGPRLEKAPKPRSQSHR
jgi:hypothetical protein